MDNSFKKMIGRAPRTPGVYLFSNRKKEVLYVGKAINLRNRLQSYNDPKLQGKTALMVSEAKNLRWIRVFSEIEALILEAELIKKYQPLYNLRLKDDKSFLYIGITQEEFPKVLSVRKKDLLNPKHLFGPFPSAKTARHVLSFLRKIYPYCQQKTNRRPCFWSHLKLCDPCPGWIKQQSDNVTKLQSKKAYLKNIKNLVYILSGKNKNLVSNLTKQMNQAVKSENFEQAAFYRNQIQKLNYVTHNPHHLSSFLESPNFFEAKQKEELNDLIELLNKYFVIPAKARIQALSRIECFDISNLSGQFSVGSMVVFLDGVADKSQYRRFKIKIGGQPNDVEMMRKMIKRRIKHQEWSYPDLIVVDGGKGQVGICISALVQCNKNIPVIGLAKRLETIIVPIFQRHPEFIPRHSELGSESVSNKERMLKTLNIFQGQHDELKFREINLPPNSPALNLLKRLRDETHRFAITYHRQLRRKAFLFD